MPADPHRVAVVGGGIAGLVTARDLARAGHAVDLFEAEIQPGGKIKQVSLGGQNFDIGAEAFATRGGSVSELLAELGIAEQTVTPATIGSWFLRGCRAAKFPAAGALGIPARPLSRESVRALGIAGAVRAAAEPLLPRAHGRDAATVADLVRARSGARVLNRLVRPIAQGVYSNDPESLPVSAVPGLAEALSAHRSLQCASQSLRARSIAAGSAVAALPGGMGVLVDALTAELVSLGVNLHLGSAVTGLEHRAPRWRVTTRSVVGDAEQGTAHDADAVVVATPESAARRLLRLPGDRAREHTVEVIALLLDTPALDAAPRGTGVLVARTAGAQTRVWAKALTHTTAKWPDRGQTLPPGQHVIRLSYGRAHETPRTLGLSDADALALAVTDAACMLGAQLSRAQVLDWARQPWQMPAPRPANPPVPPVGVAITGDWVAGAGLAATISHARATARRLTSETTR